ncbi:2'-5' RNA ligase family protein [Candidatus Micrarchaeota archaeon]|nr:2'-5' RNA ligase family protein [Candidatus Micrarchaeota archaeon]
MLLVFALIPEQRIYDHFMRLKKRIRNLVGPQTYLDDEPHLTLYIADFKSFSDIETIVKKFAASLKKKSFRVREWSVFSNDSVTGKETIVCMLEKESLESIRRAQVNLVNSLRAYRTKTIPKRYLEKINSFPEALAKNVREYGYPFVGDILIPHFSLASIDPSKFHNAWELVKNESLDSPFHFDRFSIYALSEKEELSLIKSYEISD